jgi:hypothetical protein
LKLLSRKKFGANCASSEDNASINLQGVQRMI